MHFYGLSLSELRRLRLWEIDALARYMRAYYEAQRG
jgi:hypothetical protein